MSPVFAVSYVSGTTFALSTARSQLDLGALSANSGQTTNRVRQLGRSPSWTPERKRRWSRRYEARSAEAISPGAPPFFALSTARRQLDLGALNSNSRQTTNRVRQLGRRPSWTPERKRRWSRTDEARSAEAISPGAPRHCILRTIREVPNRIQTKCHNFA